MPNRAPNRLAREQSPYLLQHAHNPVDWFPWGPEALAKAVAEDKPIFLSVGYSACHWCHVMERESFENDAVAQLLNERFVSIKADREERPDVDEVYMTAVQILTGQGGWPMSVFLLPDGRPFYGGTYYPPETRGNRIGFLSLLSQLSSAYQSRRGDVEQSADEIMESLRTAALQRPPSTLQSEIPDSSELLQTALDDMRERYDAVNGGFGGAPKFPPHHALRLLCEAARRGDDSAGEMLFTTLEKMALGGIYDHIGGGFHRYATDDRWFVPHFEKMLYDNALLARVYAAASALPDTRAAACARIARETCDWVLRDLADSGGAFHAALDADSEGEEGKYYVWAPEEVSVVLGDEAATSFEKLYNIIPGGNFRDEATGHKSGANIPHLAIGPASAVLPSLLDTSIQDSRAALLAARYERIAPAKDVKVITAWNGLMIGALAFAGKTLDEPRYIHAAQRAALFCLTILRPGGKLVRRYAGGEAGIPAFLDDHAYLADGLLDLYDATGDESYLLEAGSLADTILEQFADTADGGLFSVGANHEKLVVRTKDLFDGALPSANGVAVRVLTRLGMISGGEKYASAGRSVLTAYHALLQRAPQGMQTLILAALDAFPAAVSPTIEPISPPAVLASHVVQLNLAAGESATLTFTLALSPGFHANSRIANEGLIPTVATFATNAPASVGPLLYPEAQIWTGPDGTAIPAYIGEIRFSLPISVSPDALSGSYRVTLNILVQICSESECLPPTELSAIMTIQVS